MYGTCEALTGMIREKAQGATIPRPKIPKPCQCSDQLIVVKKLRNGSGAKGLALSV
jgi:hypothetical protein